MFRVSKSPFFAYSSLAGLLVFALIELCSLVFSGSRLFEEETTLIPTATLVIPSATPTVFPTFTPTPTNTPFPTFTHTPTPIPSTTPTQTHTPQGYSLEQVQRGKTSYLAICSSCHGNQDNLIVGNLIGKDLRNNTFVQSLSDEELLAFVQVGRSVEDPLNTTGIVMPARGSNPNLTDSEILDIIAYLRTLDNGVVIEGMETAAGTPTAELAQVVPRYVWVRVIDEKFDSPLNVVSPGDGSGRLFVVEQTGFILVIQDESYETFLDISPLVPDSVYSGGYTEQGLLGLAFHPDYESNGIFFISYTNRDGDSVLARYTVDPQNPNHADPASGVILLTVDQPFEDHNGGNIVFGQDGYLYMGFGDGGRPAEPNYNSQDPQQYLGKLLRLDINAETYAIPPDNPFVDNPDYLPEIWALGLRNPWRFTFDRATGDLYIADVGQWLIEEVDFQPASSTGGENYGWSAYEGSQVYLADETVLGEHTPPILEYGHDLGCSVTGGYVYRGEAIPELQGRYLYGDYCSGTIWLGWQDSSGAWRSAVFMDTEFVISSFGEDEDGELYLVDYKGGIYRLEIGTPSEASIVE
jgi:glucose/arabinose dehydrogenase